MSSWLAFSRYSVSAVYPFLAVQFEEPIKLSKRQTGKTFYRLDEPTGLHFDDAKKLLDLLHRLIGLTCLGDSPFITDHGSQGGRSVVQCTPGQVARVKRSYTKESVEVSVCALCVVTQTKDIMSGDLKVLSLKPPYHV